MIRVEVRLHQRPQVGVTHLDRDERRVHPHLVDRGRPPAVPEAI